MTTIQLTKQDAELFLVFREHQDFFDRIIHEKIHLMTNGNAILSFNNQGQLAKVKLEQIVYKR